MSHPDLKPPTNQTKLSPASKTHADALMAQFWRQFRRVMVPPVVAGALLMGGCVDEAPVPTGDAFTFIDIRPDIADSFKDAGETEVEPIFTEGRPFFVDGAMRFSCIEDAEGWSEAIGVSSESLSDDQRAALSAHWVRVAQGEHASIASFGRFTLELLQLGAPETLLSQAADALKDEIRHARIALSMAAAYGGHPVAPAPLDISGSLGSTNDRAAILTDIIIGGCINETLAAVKLRMAAEGTADPTVRQVLEALSEDESRHAALAWETASWMLAQWPELRGTAATAFEGAGFGVSKTSVDPALQAHGCLSQDGQRAAFAHAMQTVIEPCKTTLLAMAA